MKTKNSIILASILCIVFIVLGVSLSKFQIFYGNNEVTYGTVSCLLYGIFLSGLLFGGLQKLFRKNNSTEKQGRILKKCYFSLLLFACFVTLTILSLSWKTYDITEFSIFSLIGFLTLYILILVSMGFIIHASTLLRAIFSFIKSRKSKEEKDAFIMIITIGGLWIAAGIYPIMFLLNFFEKGGFPPFQK